MDKTAIIEAVEIAVKNKLLGNDTAHDYFHARRVANTALFLGRIEEADLFVCEVSALLHDIGDYKFHDGDESVAPRMIQEIMDSCGISDSEQAHIQKIISAPPYHAVSAACPLRKV